MIDSLAPNHDLIITLEENVKSGGFGERVTDYLKQRWPEVSVMNITLPDDYVEHGDVTKLRSVLGIDSDSIMEKIEKRLAGSAGEQDP
jgi:1-deoxy-D-xylulose-5-phosphate synthase